MIHATNIGPQQPAPTYAAFIPACKAHDIGRTNAFKMAAAGLIDTFLIGSKRYVMLESLRTLPERLKAQGGAQ